jgi:hypothetical protein
MTIDENPYAPPKASSGAASSAPREYGDDEAPRPYVDGVALVVHERSKLPKRCIKCSTKEGLVPFTPEFSYVPVWARLGFGALGALAFRRVAKIPLPICGPCQALWQERSRAHGLLVLGMLGLVLLPVFLMSAVEREARGPLGLLVLVAIVALVAIGYSRRKSHVDPYVIRSTFVKDRSAWLLGANPEWTERAIRGKKRRSEG